METTKIVFFESQKVAGICDTQEWNRKQEEKELNPTRICLLECSNKYIADLMDVLDTNQKEFIRLVRDELNNSDCILF